jgi:hypothetical protein
MGRIILVLAIIVLTAAFVRHDGILRAAIKAVIHEHIISNEAMSAFYPSSFRPGSPPYFERDFEAGANFICDEIKIKHGRDLCAEIDIKWR